MTLATTWAEFVAKPDSEKRVIFRIVALNSAAPPATKSLWFSNIAGAPPSGLAFYLHPLSSVPNLAYNTSEIGGNPPVPSWSALSIMRQDGEDISPDVSGIYDEDIGTSWIVRDQICTGWLGGEALPFSEYKPIFGGTMGGVSRNDTEITIECLGYENRAQRSLIGVNVVTTATWPNAPTGNLGKTYPVCVGYCWNTEPLCVDTRTVAPNNLRFLFHDVAYGPYTSIAVYDAGVTLTGGGMQYTDNGDGTFTLAPGYMPNGKITCTVLGTWAFTAWATVITNALTTWAGIPAGQIDAASVAAANIALPYQVSCCIRQETSVMETVRLLSSGIPAKWGFDPDGIFRMEEITDPGAKTPDFYMNSEVSNQAPIAIDADTLNVRPSGTPINKCFVEYFENYSPIDRANLAASLTETQKSLFMPAYRKDSYTDGTVSALYANPSSLSVTLRTYTTTYTQSAAIKWVNLFKTERRYVKFRIKSMNTFKIGDIVSITFAFKTQKGATYYRHGFNDSRFMIMGVKQDYNNYITELEMWG